MTDGVRVLLLDLGSELRGGQRQVMYLAQTLERLRNGGERVETLVACPRESVLAQMLDDAGLPFLPLPGRGIANPAVLLALRGAIRRHSINILHTHDARAATLGSWFKRWNAGLLLVHSRRVSYPLKPGARSQKYHAADAVVAVSRDIGRILVGGGLDAAKVHTIHSGIDPDRYEAKRDRQDGRFVFGAIGALTSQKGFNVLIEAMSVLAAIEDLLPWEVRIIGEGPLFQELLTKARAIGVADRLALFGKQDSRYYLPDFDALLVPSVDGEGSNAVIKEGWAVGIPVACSSLASNEELVHDKVNGLVVSTGNPLALGAAMLRLVKEPELRERLVTGGRETLLTFTAEHMAMQTFSLYCSLLGCTEERASVPADHEPVSPSEQANETSVIHDDPDDLSRS